MNFFNKILCITALFAINSVIARSVASSTSTVKNQVSSEKIATSPFALPISGAEIKAQSYKDLRHEVLRMNASSVINNNTFDDMFLNKMAQKSKALNIGAVGFKAILQTTRDKFASFSSNNEEALRQLIAINQQIDDAVNFFNEFK